MQVTDTLEIYLQYGKGDINKWHIYDILLHSPYIDSSTNR